MSSTPVLSYKKPSVNKPGPESKPQSQSASPSVSKPGTPRLGSTDDSAGSKSGRKVSSRRKALQDFYHIQNQQQQERINTSKSTDNVDEIDHSASIAPSNKPSKVDLSNPEALQTFIKESPIEDILKLRNSITNDLNSHDSAKKSIIYDNYYELIKLNQVLGDLSKSKPASNSAKTGSGSGLESLGITTNSNPTYNITDSYIDDVFRDLSKFISEAATPFNSSFEGVVENLQQEVDDGNSASSIQGISGTEPIPKYSEAVNKQALVKEITAVLGNAKLIQDESIKKEYKNSIQIILSKLDPEKDELLILQLNDLRKKFL